MAYYADSDELRGASTDFETAQGAYSKAVDDLVKAMNKAAEGWTGPSAEQWAAVTEKTGTELPKLGSNLGECVKMFASTASTNDDMETALSADISNLA